MTLLSVPLFDLVTTFSLFCQSFSVPTIVIIICTFFIFAFPFAIRDCMRNSSLFNRDESEDDKQ